MAKKNIIFTLFPWYYSYRCMPSMIPRQPPLFVGACQCVEGLKEGGGAAIRSNHLLLITKWPTQNRITYHDGEDNVGKTREPGTLPLPRLMIRMMVMRVWSWQVGGGYWWLWCRCLPWCGFFGFCGGEWRWVVNGVTEKDLYVGTQRENVL